MTDAPRTRRYRLPLYMVLFAFLGALFVLLFNPEAKDEAARPLEHFKPWDKKRINENDSFHFSEIRTADHSTNNAQREESHTPTQEEDAMPNEQLLYFKDQASFEAFLSSAEANGVSIIDSIPALGIARVSDWHKHPLNGTAIPDEQIGLNYRVRIPTPQMPSYENKTLVNFENKAIEWLNVESHENWGEGIKVAVLDTGVSEHPTFSSAQIEEIDLIGTPAEAAHKTDHGTAVLSLIAGTHEQAQGIAPKSNLLSLKVLGPDGQGDHFTLAKGIITAVDEQAQILNLSLGSPNHSPVLKAAIDYALSNGVIIVAAAGNEGAQALAYPAAYPEVISVAAIDALKQHPSFSNQSADLDIAAPGVGLYAAWENDKLVQTSGTSMAASYVTATLSALLSQHPELSPMDARNILLSHTDDYGMPGNDPSYGNGILSPQRALDFNKKDIYDLAISSIYAPKPRNGALPLVAWVGIQNRGTEKVYNAYCIVNINGLEKQHELGTMLPNATHSIKVDLSPFSHPENTLPIKIKAYVSSRPSRDASISNNQSQASWGTLSN